MISWYLPPTSLNCALPSVVLGLFVEGRADIWAWIKARRSTCFINCIYQNFVVCPIVFYGSWPVVVFREFLGKISERHDVEHCCVQMMGFRELGVVVFPIPKSVKVPL